MRRSLVESPAHMRRGPIVRCFLVGSLAVLLFLHAQPVFAANPAGISIHTDPFWSDGLAGLTDYSGDWRPLCSPGPTNEVRWYTADGVQQNATLRDFDCGLGMPDNASWPAGRPGAVSLWLHPQSIVPSTLPHGLGTGTDGDFYLTLTARNSEYTLPGGNPTGILIHPDPVWNGDYSASDYTDGWLPFCTSGETNVVRWYTGDNSLRSQTQPFDCSGSIFGGPGIIPLWSYGSSIIPATLPHNVGNSNLGADGSFYLTLTNADNTVTRFDWSWTSTTTTTRFDWGWHNGAYTFPTTEVTPSFCTPVVDTDCNSNVMFLPGIEGSRLYRNARPDEAPETIRKLWEPHSNSDAQYLAIGADGVTSAPVFTRDVIDNAYVPGKGNVYISFMADMDKLVADKKINDWQAVPYDWRLQLDALISSGKKDGQNISYLDATSSPYILQELKRLAANSKTGKVTIIAHSNGGLVAKEMMIALGADANKFVDKIIFVAVPQVGTPQAVAALLHGYQSAMPSEAFHFVDDATIRSAADTMPGLYNLLPSNGYFSKVADPVVSISGTTLPEWASRFGTSISSSAMLGHFLTDTSRTVPRTDELASPTILSNDLVSKSNSTHAILDAWVPPAGVELIQVAGWGVPTTVKSVDYASTSEPVFCNGFCESGFTMSAETTLDGDGTVVTPSALWNETGANVKNYWLNLADYNSLLNRIRNIHFKYEHGTIFEVDPLQELLSNLVTNKDPGPLENISQDKPTVAPSAKRLVLSLHSPLTFNMYDNQGHHVGVATSTGETVQEIPGTYYAEIAGVKYIFTDESVPVHVVMDGYADGSFTFNVQEFVGETLTASTTFKDIPTTPNTRVTLNIPTDITSLSPMNVDLNGDGTNEFSLQKKLNGVVTIDTEAPTTTAALAGTKGSSDWYVSDVRVTFNATDTMSGVDETFFSLDGAATSSATSTRVTTEGRHVVSFYSVDHAGNRETLRSVTFKIDKTAPEAKMVFDPVSQTLSVTGSDSQSSTTVQTSATTSVVTDRAGHTLQIFFAQHKVKSNRISATISKLSYDGVAATSTASLKYKWSTGHGAYKMFASFLNTKSSALEAHFRPKKNVTIFMTPPADIDDSDNDDASDMRPVKITVPGMVVPYLSTSNGRILISY